jgi:hypothetical protein
MRERGSCGRLLLFKYVASTLNDYMSLDQDGLLRNEIEEILALSFNCLKTQDNCQFIFAQLMLEEANT